MRNAFFMAYKCSDAYPELDIHMSDSCDIIVARNVLITQVILEDSFDPENLTDCQYLWELLYGCQWTNGTRQRFIRDAKKLLTGKFTNLSVIFHGAMFNQTLQKILKSWLDTASNMTELQINKILKQRY